MILLQEQARRPRQPCLRERKHCLRKLDSLSLVRIDSHRKNLFPCLILSVVVLPVNIPLFFSLEDDKAVWLKFLQYNRPGFYSMTFITDGQTRIFTFPGPLDSFASPRGYSGYSHQSFFRRD